MLLYIAVFNPRDARDHLKSDKYKKIKVIALHIYYTLLRLLVITTLLCIEQKQYLIITTIEEKDFKRLKKN